MLKPPVHRALPMPLLAAGMVLLAAGAACTFLTPTPIAWTATATPRPSPPPSETAAARLPAQPPTLEPTATPTRPVGTAAPTAPPESKPLLLYGQGAEVSAWDPAAAHATAVSLESPLFWPGDLGSGASPAGQWLAVRAGHSGLADLSLDLIQFPQGAVRAHIPLLAESVRAKLPAGGAGRLPDAAAAAVQPDTLAWSPDGHLLAFVGAQDGPSADLYLFDTATGKARRLTAGLNQVASPAWSPDGQWVFFQEVLSFGSTPGWKMGSVWAAAADHNEARKLYTPPSNSTREVMLGWSAADTLLTGTRAPDGLHDLRAVPVSGRFVNPIYGGPLDLAAFDPTSQVLAFTETAQTGAGIGLAAGLYRLAGLKGSPQLVQAGNWTSLEFSPALKRFLAGGEQGLLLFDPGGSTLLIKNEAAGLPSPDGHWLAAWGSGAHPGLRLYQPDGTLLQQVSADAVAQLSWQPDSKAFYFLAADRLYRVSFPQAQPVQIDQGVLAGSLAWLGGR